MKVSYRGRQRNTKAFRREKVEVEMERERHSHICHNHCGLKENDVVVIILSDGSVELGIQGHQVVWVSNI